jgi:hypothetical protein
MIQIGADSGRAGAPPLGGIAMFLNRLGATPDEVAATLRTAGMRGPRGSFGFHNPVVRHLNQNLEIGARLEVNAEGTVLRVQFGGAVTEVTLPPAVGAFLVGFQSGAYPEIESV